MAEKRRFQDTYIGEGLGPVRYKVTQEMVAYALSQMLGSSSWYSDDTLFGGPIAPSTVTDNDYAVAYRDKFTDEASLHAKAEHHYSNPPFIGKDLIVTGKVSDKYSKRGRDFIVFETVTRDEDEREIVRSKNILVIGLK